MLFDIMRKTFESILARKINTITKIYYLLLDTQFGKKRNILIEHTIYFLIEKINAA